MNPNEMNKYPFESTSRIEISESAFRNNLDFIQKQVGEKTQISAVVKANAYGHSFETFIPMAERAGIRHFSVFSLEEAWNVKQLLQTDADIMIMGSVPDAALEWVVANRIEVFIFEPERLKAILKIALQLDVKARIHLEFETGMNRTGFLGNEIPVIRAILDLFPDAYTLE
ncbi:MAG TPA: alanine racemase, partial [Bacteroidetes bacterium]|nr:alanine racemase [Bacteroidota bacterium]